MIYNLIGKAYNGISFIDVEDMKVVGFKRINDELPYELQINIGDKLYWYKLCEEKGEPSNEKIC